jgi:hypothetical protein
MKKLLKLFGLLLAMGTLFCLSSCDDLFNMDNNEDKPVEEKAKEYVKSTDAINHEFYLSDDKTSYIYYTSTKLFSYENYTDCVYQISFTPKDSAASKGTWKLYTRPIASTKTIEMVYSGTFKAVGSGSIRNGGTVELLINDEVVDTLTVENKTVTTATGVSKTAYAFTANVAASHKAIGAKDAK